MKNFLKIILGFFKVLPLVRAARPLFWLMFDALCGIFVRSAFPAVPAPDTVKSVLIIRRDRLGDVVLSTPAFRAVRQTYPAAQIHLFVNDYTRDLVVNNPNINHLILAEGQMVKNTYDIAVILHPGFTVNRLAYKSKARIRLGYSGSGGSFFLNYKVPDDRQQRPRHEVESALEVVARLGCKTSDTRLEVSVTPEGERFAEQFFKQHGLAGRTVVAIHPGARQLYIRWKLDGFADVGARLSAEKGAAVVIIGSVSEVDLVAAVASSIPGAVQAVGLPVAGLVSVLKRCQLFIGNSTGPMHIASALGVPVVALFGSHHALDSPRAWQPWGLRSVVIAKDPGCRACHPGDCRDYRCMESITAGEVYHAACKLLDHADATL